MGLFFKMCSSKDVASPLQLGFTGHLMCQWELCFPAKLWGNTPGPCGSWAARDWGHLADAGREGSEEARGVARLQFRVGYKLSPDGHQLLGKRLGGKVIGIRQNILS